MKKKFLIKFFSIIFALGLINSSVVLAKVKQAAQQEKKVLTNSEKEKIINSAIEKNKQEFKNFNKKDYELEGFSLNVYFKNFVPILSYEHNKTKAKVVLVPNFANYLENRGSLRGETFFSLPVTNEKGINHILEHCISTPEIDKISLKNYNKNNCEKNSRENIKLNATTLETGLHIHYLADLFKTNEKEFKKAYEFLAKPSFLNGDEKIFKKEIKRILNEIKKDRCSKFNMFLEFTVLNEKRDFSQLGDYKNVKNTKLKEIKESFNEYIHPSNSLTINYLDFNPKNVKKYLNILKDSYFEKFSYKKPPILKSKFKNKTPYTLNNWTGEGGVFLNYSNTNSKKPLFKYTATVVFNLEDLNIKNRIDFDLDYFEEKFKEFAKNLGYSHFYCNNFLGNRKILPEKAIKFKFSGDKKELFTQKALKENVNKILNLFLKEANLSKDENFLEKTQSKFQNANENEYKIFADPKYFAGFSDLQDLLRYSFFKTKEPFSKEVFNLKGNEIIFSKEILKESFNKNFEVFNKLIKSGPSYIDVLKRDDSLKKDVFSKYNVNFLNVPIKFKKCDDVLLENTARIIFADHLLQDFFEKGLGYAPARSGNFHDGFVANIIGDLELKNEIYSYLKNKENFEKLISSFKVTQKDLNLFKKCYKEKSKENVKEIKATLKKLKLLKSYMKKLIKKEIKSFNLKELGSISKNSKVVDLSRIFLEANSVGGIASYEFYKDKEKAIKNKIKLKKYHEIKPKNYDKTLKEKDLKFFVENCLNPTLENLEALLKIFRNNLKNLDNLKISAISNLVKTAYLADKSETEKEDEIFEKFNHVL